MVNNFQDLEAVVDDVADSVVSGHGLNWRVQFCRVRSREGLVVARSWDGGWFPGTNEFQTFEDFGGAGRAVLGLGCEKV